MIAVDARGGAILFADCMDVARISQRVDIGLADFGWKGFVSRPPLIDGVRNNRLGRTVDETFWQGFGLRQ
jgi:hypothetical protein